MVIPAMPTSTGTVYEIRVEGHLGTNRGRSFPGYSVILDDDGQTVITGEVADQAALHAVLTKIRDLGAVLVSVNRANAPGSATERSKR